MLSTHGVSRSCWEKELQEAEQRCRAECLVQAFPHGVKHVTVFLEISQQMATRSEWGMEWLGGGMGMGVFGGGFFL